MESGTLRGRIGAFGFVLGTCVPVLAQSTTRVSLATGGAEGNDDCSVGGAISGNGRFVAFLSSASNLVAGDTNGTADVFVHDRVLGTTERASVASGGAQGNGGALSVGISSDGRFVVFTSGSTNLVAGDTNARQDCFVRDRQAGTTERVSLDSGEAQSNDHSYDPVISSDGRYVAFSSSATNLVAGDANGTGDIFLRDRQAGTTELVSVDSGETQGNGNCSGPSISDDGSCVAFSSGATNLVAGDTNGEWDVFVRDRSSGTTERASVDSGEAQGNDLSSIVGGSLSSDGRYVVFDSYATNLVALDTNGGIVDSFLRDRLAGTTELVSISSGELQGSDFSGSPVISDDGRYVAFSSLVNFDAGDTNGWLDVYVRDRTLGTTSHESLPWCCGSGDGNSITTSMSSDGRHVAFWSRATNLLPGDTNGFDDIFVRDRDESGFMPFCFPEVSGVRSCPCGNPPTSADAGCDSFTTSSTVSGAGGAKLTVSGVPSCVPVNTLVFHVTQAHNPGSNTNLHVFWRGTSALAVGVKSGFGVRCVAGSLKRIYQGVGTGVGGLGSTNAIDFPNGTQTTDAWTASLMPDPGTTLFYYDSFRDQQGPTTCNTANDRFNVSHAGAVTWLP